MKKFYFGCLWLALGAVCWTLCLSAWAAHGTSFGDAVSYRDPNGNMSFESLKELRRQMDDSGAVTGWGQSLRITVEAVALNETASTDIIWVDGDAERIWSPRMVAGQMPVEGDNIGCALDEVTALKLFGTVDILGLEVKVNGENMTVRGVFALPESIPALGVDPGRGMAFCPARLSSGANMSALEFSVRPADGKTAAEAAEEYMRSAGMSAEGAFDDHKDANDLMEFLCGLPGDALALAAILQLLMAIVALSRSKLEALRQLREDIYSTTGAMLRVVVSWLFVAALLGALCYAGLRLTTHGGRIPPAYLPTRWSDFSFWPRLIEEFSQNGADKRLTGALLPDMFGGRLHGLAAAFGLAAIVLNLMALRNLRGCAAVSAARATAGVLTVLAAPAFALWLAGALNWRVSAVPMALRALPAGALLIWIVPGNFRPAIKLTLPKFGGRNAWVSKRAEQRSTIRSIWKGDYT